MFVPLHDDNTLRAIRFQFVTGAIIFVNIAVHLLLTCGNLGMSPIALATAFGLVPAEIGHIGAGAATQAGGAMALAVPEPLTLITYTFIHGGWLHLAANMAFMWVFADNVEDAFGHVGFLLLYFVCGIIAAGAHIVANPDSTVPLVGASGAVSGILGSYMVLFPKARVWVLFMKLPIPFRISALWALAMWIGFQVLALYIDDGKNEVLVAWWAHIGGFAAGFLITSLFRRTLAARLA
jgi:membrane associated rhomboid family serine protease